MYERFYNLRERPFALSPDPEYLYLSRVHREALDAIRYGVESRVGFIVVTGEIGAGKTTLLQTLLQRLDERAVVARLVNTTLEPRELLEAILLDFGLPAAERSKPALLRDLGTFLVQQRAQGRRPLLVIDEAQNLSPAALEEVRLLSNLETEKSKLLQILVAGQPNLRDTMATPELEQFRQRVAVSYHLTALDAPDTAAYINYRLQHAAIGAPLRFPEDAADLVHARSGGVPRVINVICDATLVFGYAEERRSIDRGLLEEVVAELELTGVLPARPAAAEAPPVPSLAAGAETAAGGRIDEPQERHLLGARQALAAAREAAALRELELSRERELLNRQLAELRAREEALAQRERQIAEQRHIMSEEYRLLRQQRADRAARPAYSHAGAGRGAARPLSATGGPLARSELARQQPFWQRVFRLFGREAALRS
jgi:putative secretion ATPase (PEP-CTERM system associated)